MVLKTWIPAFTGMTVLYFVALSLVKFPFVVPDLIRLALAVLPGVMPAPVALAE